MSVLIIMLLILLTSTGNSDNIMNSIETDTIISQLNHTLYHSFCVKAVDKAGRNGVFSNTEIFHFSNRMYLIMATIQII